MTETNNTQGQRKFRYICECGKSDLLSDIGYRELNCLECGKKIPRQDLQEARS